MRHCTPRSTTAETTAMSVIVRPIAVEDAPGFHACLDTVAREGRYLAQVQAPPLDKVRGFVADSVASGVAQVVAVDLAAPGAPVVGWADVFPAWAAALQHTGRLGMGLLPAYRGRGLGEQLLRACLARAQANGLTRVALEARADNTAAIRLYERVGFVHEGLARRALRFDGRYFDGVMMALLLGDAAATP